MSDLENLLAFSFVHVPGNRDVGAVMLDVPSSFIVLLCYTLND